MEVDALLLSRFQFAFTVAFHIIFPSFTIGLASYLAVLEGLWLWTKREVFLRLYLFWVKVFALSFGMGVVSGVVMSYQFGTNWSRFSELTGNVLGPLLAYEVLTAFFLEASFLGIMLFGWRKVGRGLHFLSTSVVAVGTVISAFWILAANSWMHTPAGYVMEGDRFVATDWWAVVFNPSFPDRFMHMVLAAYLTTSLVVLAVGAWHLLRDAWDEAARTMSVMAIGMLVVVTPLQILVGHEHGLTVRDTQPAKLAAMEAVWETERGAPLVLFAFPDEEAETNRFEIGIPYLASLIVTSSLDGEIRGLTTFAKDERPPVAIVFYAFRTMVGLGMAMLGLGIAGAWLLWRRRLVESPWYLRACVAMGPAGFVAVIAGWITTEVGRQPYTVHGLLRTADSVSPIPAEAAGLSLFVFVVVYFLVFGAGIFYVLKQMAKGPKAIQVGAYGETVVGAQGAMAGRPIGSEAD